jgi:RNA polymerase sigma factor (sigma-70 family)
MQNLALVPSPHPAGGWGVAVLAAGPEPARVDVDPQLLARAQAYLACRGEARADPRLCRAWEDLFAILGPMVHAMARVGRRARIDPADAEQEALAALVARIPAYRPDPARGPFLAWAATVVRHALANLARRHAGWRRERPPHRPGFEAWTIADDLERAERRERLRRGLLAFRAEAGPVAFRVVLLHWIAGQTVDAVAARLGLTRGQVIGHLHRAIPRLRARFTP